MLKKERVQAVTLKLADDSKKRMQKLYLGKLIFNELSIDPLSPLPSLILTLNDLFLFCFFNSF